MSSEKLLPFAAALGPLNLTLAICTPLLICWQVPVFTSKKGQQNPFLHGKVMSSREAQVLEALRGKRTAAQPPPPLARIDPVVMAGRWVSKAPSRPSFITSVQRHK
ncbi:hypothetical protein NC651_013530 [Populus alba x Populus x berolinensis]|nr:hypothetical protein NC651_013530 [Populus alba x Populus x berolinensis]